MSRTFTPAEVVEEIGNISEYDLRRRARQGEIAWTRGPRARVLFTRPQIEQLLKDMEQPVRAKRAPDPVAAEPDNVFGATDRSHARTRSGSRVG